MTCRSINRKYVIANPPMFRGTVASPVARVGLQQVVVVGGVHPPPVRLEEVRRHALLVLQTVLGSLTRGT